MIDRSILGIAGEYAVAEELCRRNIYAQLTMGHQKRTDILVFGKAGAMHRIEVKAKQAKLWPNCRGIFAQDSFLVFVDYAGKQQEERPDFYILTAQEWFAVVKAERKRYLAKYPKRRAEVTKEGVLRLLDEVNARGQTYQGMGVKPEYIQDHRETWGKIADVVTQ